MGLTLIMPVHNGGDKFRLCLKSLYGYTKLFDRIVISLNSGDKNIIEENSIDEICTPEQKQKLQVIRHSEVLRPTNHLYLIAHSKEMESLSERDPVMFLFHDDFLLGENLRLFLSDDTVDLVGSVVLGPWLKRFEGGASIETGISTLETNATPAKIFLEETAPWPPWTNASGMIAPFGSVLDFVHAFRHSQHGARMEWSLIASRHSQIVVTSKAPLVSILDHPGQSGKQLSYSDYQMDEIRFQILLFRSGKMKSVRLFFFFSLRVAWAMTIISISSIFKLFSVLRDRRPERLDNDCQ